MKAIIITQKHIDRMQSKLDEATNRNQKLKLIVEENKIGMAIGKFEQMKDLKLNKEKKEAVKIALDNSIRESLKYNFSLVNVDSGLSTIVMQMPLAKIIQLLQSFERGVKTNIKEGLAVSGSSKNSRLGSSKVTQL